MDKPKHGSLVHMDSKWFFKSGKGASSQLTELLDFPSVARDMIKKFILFQGHRRARDIQHLRSTIQLQSAVARHVSAEGLSSTVSPSTLKDHSDMSTKDKSIWDAAYMEEIDGLRNRQTWEVITDAEYRRIKHKVKATLPSMAISTIKCDESGKPKRAKYRIVALGNLDPVH